MPKRYRKDEAGPPRPAADDINISWGAFFMSAILQYFSQQSSTVQAICAVLSVIVITFTAIFTLIYVRLTSDLVNIPYKAFLRPKKLEWKNKISSFDVVIMNYGPGMSSMTKVSSYTNVQLKKESNKADYLFYKKMLIAEGPDEIKAGEERIFTINGYFIENCYFILEYQSLTRKKYINIWKCKGYKQEEITLLNCFDRIKFLKIRLLGFILKPYIAYKSRKYYELDYTTKTLLKRLNIMGALYYDELADYSVKSDEQIKELLENIRKEGYISYEDGEPFKYRISEKGYQSLKKDELVGREYFNDDPDHLKYDGMFKDGKYHGTGTYYVSNRKIYSGEWNEGKRCGKGTSYGVNEQIKYEGDWENDRMSGVGRLYDDTGNIKYEGEFLDGKEID